MCNFRCFIKWCKHWFMHEIKIVDFCVMSHYISPADNKKSFMISFVWLRCSWNCHSMKYSVMLHWNPKLSSVHLISDKVIFHLEWIIINTCPCTSTSHIPSHKLGAHVLMTFYVKQSIICVDLIVLHCLSKYKKKNLYIKKYAYYITESFWKERNSTLRWKSS